MRLTKTSLSILGAVVLLALTDVWLDNWMGHLWPLIAATWIVLLLIERSMFFRQKPVIERHTPDTLYLGQTAQFTYQITNTRRQPLRLRTHDIFPQQIKASQEQRITWNLAGHEQQTRIIELQPVATGSIQLQVIQTAISGWLALAWWNRTVTVPVFIRILPDYRSKTSQPRLIDSQPRQPLLLRSYSSVTFIINHAQLNQLVTRGLRRFDRYINHCSAVAYQAINVHHSVNVIVYDKEPLMTMTGITKLSELGQCFNRLQVLTSREHADVHHQCILGILDRLPNPGVLIWYSDIDDPQQTKEITRIAQILQHRFQVHIFDASACETALLEKDIADNCRSPYHKLAVMDVFANWKRSKRLLHAHGLRTISRSMSHL